MRFYHDLKNKEEVEYDEEDQENEENEEDGENDEYDEEDEEDDEDEEDEEDEEYDEEDEEYGEEDAKYDEEYDDEEDDDDEDEDEDEDEEEYEKNKDKKNEIEMVMNESGDKSEDDYMKESEGECTAHEPAKIKFSHECIICTENLRPKTLECGHSFHPSCLNQWFAINKTCPICRNSTKNKIDEYVEVPFNDFLIFHQRLLLNNLFRITYNLVSGEMEERVVVMKKFIGVREVAKPSHNSPLLVMKVVGDNFDRKIYFGKITKVEAKVE